MLSPRLLLLGAMLCQLSYEVYAMECNVGGLVIGCPTVLDDSNAVFCCKSSLSSNIEVCCELGDYLKQNTAILAGILVGILIILIIITLCCCCFCSCCFLAKRRVQRGTVLYDPIRSGQQIPPPSTAPYPLLHNPTASQYPSPPPYQPPTNPNFNAYPPQNPYYK